MVTYHSSSETWLRVGQYKSLKVYTCLEIDTKDDDDYTSREDVICKGTIMQDVYFGNTHLKKGTYGTLTIKKGDKTTKLNVVLGDLDHVENVTGSKHRRYYWLFNTIGKPLQDNIELYPKILRVLMRKVYIITDFQGFSSLPVAGYVTAINPDIAKQLFDQQLEEAGLTDRQHVEYTLHELNLAEDEARILVDGGDF